MKVELVQRQGAVEVILQGKLDIDEADAFEQEFGNILKEDSTVFGINLQKVDYIDSSGLGVLIKVMNLAKNGGKVVEFYGATPKINNIFKLARLDKFFTFTSPVEFHARHPGKEDQEIDDLIDSL